MNCRFYLAIVTLMRIAGLTLPGCGASDSKAHVSKIASAADAEAEGPGALTPLMVDKDAPLLLDEPSESEKASGSAATSAAANNTPCFVCHANYNAEPLAVRHAAANVGCVDCHGKSTAHCNDENNTTPPDIMYPAKQIDRSCQKCHATHDVSAVKVVAAWQQRHPNKTEPKTIVCTDCHGDHRLRLRSIRWDKKTGKLIRNQIEPK